MFPQQPLDITKSDSSGHRTIYKDHLLKLDVSFRKLGRSIVAPPSDTDWSLEWHDILHQWNIRVQDLASAAAIKPWLRIVCKQHWDLFCYVAQLPEHRWVRRMLAWNPAIRARQLGRPRHTWDQKVTAFCRYKQLGHWMEYAQDKKAWLALSGSFYNFCMAYSEAICKYGFVNIVSFGSPPAPKMGPPHGVQALTWLDLSVNEV